MRYKILDSCIDDYDINETIGKIVENIEKKILTYQVSINANKINLMDENPRLKKIINKADLINADGMSIIWAGKILKIPIKNRVTGVDLFYKLLEVSERRGYKIFFLGATESSLLKMIEIMKNEHPDIKIVGYHNGYYKDSKSIIEQIKNSEADILFLGFSSPQKEFWIENYQYELNISFIMGVGGSFDIYSGKTKRAPIFIQRIGLEWFYRFIQEPIRMYKRYIVGNISFIKKVLKEKLI